MKILHLFLSMILFLLGLSIYSQGLTDSNLELHTYLNGRKDLVLQKNGDRGILEIYFKNKVTGKIIKNFRPLHSKFMHVVGINNNSTKLTHLHPYLDTLSGRFILPLNFFMSDQDNKDGETIFARPGEYTLFFEVDFKNLGLRTFKVPFKVKDERGEVRNPEGAEEIPKSYGQIGQNIIKYFNSKGKRTRRGGKFEAILKSHILPGCGGNLISFKVFLNQKDPQFGYLPIKGLERWLMMGGHALFISADKKQILSHMHTKLPKGGDPLKFNYFDRGQLKKGQSVFWLQFKHSKKVITVPFRLQVPNIPDGELDCN